MSFFVWSDTANEVTEDIMNRACRRIVDTNSPMFMSDVEKLTASQREMIKAIVSGETHLSSERVRGKFRLGNLTTITRNKKILETKSFIDSGDGTLEISDPIFRIWFRSRYLNLK